MTLDQDDHRSGGGLRALNPYRWPLWTIPSALLGSVLVVEFVTCAVVLLLLVSDPAHLTSTRGEWFLLVLVVGVVHVEIARGIERTRWRIDGEFHVDLGSVWVFCAAVLFQPGVAALAAAALHFYGSTRLAPVRTPLYRRVFSTATIVLACIASSSVMRQWPDGNENVIAGAGPDVIVLGLGALVFLTVNTALVAGAIAMSTPNPRLIDTVGEWSENVLEIATLSLGAVAAATIMVNPLFVLFVLPPLLVLQRAVLVRQLEEAATTDGKTGLLNAAAWHAQAERELRRSERRAGPRAVLVIDLDHFKVVNDTHGHLAGDQVLAAVADALRGEVRDRDLVGRFGGEEFVVLLGGLGESGNGELEAVAERIRHRIAALRVEMPTPDGPLTVAGLSASIGGSLYPGDGRDLRTLLHVADTALYAAKRAGRNVVRLGMQLPIQAGPEPVVVHDTPADHTP